MHGYGLTDAEVAVLTDAPPITFAGTIVAEIASPNRYYGYLVAYCEDFFDADRRMLDAYANLAAVALDALSALETAAERQHTTESLLATFGHDMMIIVDIALPEHPYGILVAAYDTPQGTTRARGIINRMCGVADQAATVLRTCELLEETWRLAHVDTLTGLANRRAFMAALDTALGVGEGAVLFIDLDGFRPSTTPSATPPATNCSPRSPPGSPPRPASATWSPASAATDSSCSPTAPSAPTACRSSPDASGSRSPSRSP